MSVLNSIIYEARFGQARAGSNEAHGALFATKENNGYLIWRQDQAAQPAVIGWSQSRSDAIDHAAGLALGQRRKLNQPEPQRHIVALA